MVHLLRLTGTLAHPSPFPTPYGVTRKQSGRTGPHPCTQQATHLARISATCVAGKHGR